MKMVDAKFAFFSFGMGTAIASSAVTIYILMVSLMGGKSIVSEQNPLIALVEILLLMVSISTCIISTEIYQKYEKQGHTKKTEKGPPIIEH
jgi:hypothetical protein